jgi:hypothetical protein
MDRYIHYLLDDLEKAALQAPELSEYGWTSGLPDNDPDEQEFESASPVKLCQLFGLPAEAFPPQQLLDDRHIERLIEAIERLWNAWHLTWKMPLRLPARKQYSVMVGKMSDELICWHPDAGGVVEICHHEEGGPCPFDPNRSECYCQYIEDIARREVQAWEEHVRSQGLDPYRELTPEEEKEIEDSERRYRLKKRYGDDWKRYYYYESSWNEEILEDFHESEDNFFDDLPSWWNEPDLPDDDLDDWYFNEDTRKLDSDYLSDNDEIDDDDFILPF